MLPVISEGTVILNVLAIIFNSFKLGVIYLIVDQQESSLKGFAAMLASVGS